MGFTPPSFGLRQFCTDEKCLKVYHQKKSAGTSSLQKHLKTEKDTHNAEIVRTVDEYMNEKKKNPGTLYFIKIH